jgi:hypothetical protein
LEMIESKLVSVEGGQLCSWSKHLPFTKLFGCEWNHQTVWRRSSAASLGNKIVSVPTAQPQWNLCSIRNLESCWQSLCKVSDQQHN